MSIKLTEQEIESLKGFQQKTNAIISDLGKISFQISDLESTKKQILDVKDTMVSEQNEFFKMLETTYGKGHLNLDTFEFVPAEEPEATMEVVK